MKTMKARQGWWDAIRHVKSVARGTNPSLNPGLSWIILDFHDVSRCFRMFPGHLDQLWPATQLTNRWQIASSPGFRCFQFWQLRQLRQPMSPGCWARAVPVATWPASVAPAAAKMRGQRRMLSPLATGCWTSTCMNLSDVQWEVDAVDVESFTAKAYILHTYSYLFIERHRSDHWFGLIWHVEWGAATLKHSIDASGRMAWDREACCLHDDVPPFLKRFLCFCSKSVHHNLQFQN